MGGLAAKDEDFRLAQYAACGADRVIELGAFHASTPRLAKSR